MKKGEKEFKSDVTDALGKFESSKEQIDAIFKRADGLTKDVNKLDKQIRLGVLLSVLEGFGGRCGLSIAEEVSLLELSKSRLLNIHFNLLDMHNEELAQKNNKQSYIG